MTKTILIVMAFLTMLSCNKSTNNNFEVTNNFTQTSGVINSKNLVFDFLPKAGKNQIVKHRFFVLSYNEQAEQADWVAYELKKENVKNNDFDRPYFIEDPLVTTNSASWRNYKNSGYDKGHLCPAADMEFDYKAFTDTFFTSNISPQNKEFNSGIWNRLEQKVRYWALQNNGVYVVTGGVLNNTKKTIGTEEVVVPNYFYKIILDETNGKFKMIAFLIPNEKSSKSLYNYVVSVDEIEKITGIDFFPKLSDTVENNLEKEKVTTNWFVN